MGLLDGMIGNASKVDAAKIQADFSQILAPGEKVEHAYQLIRDYFVFTDKRFVLVDKQGITGSKVEYHSIPYKSITHFSIETAGTFDLDAELKIWISGTAAPLQKQFNKKLNLEKINSLLKIQQQFLILLHFHYVIVFVKKLQIELEKIESQNY